MAGNKTLGRAKEAKNDEFYTQFADIEREVNAYLAYDPNVFRDKTVLLPCDDPEWSNFTRYFAQNFSALGLRRLVSTGYAIESKRRKGLLPGLFPDADSADPAATHGKIFVLDRDCDGNGIVDLDDLEWRWLDGDGDFQSEEVRKLRDESNPFSVIGSDGKPHHYSSLPADQKARIAETRLTVYVCEGTETEIKEWFQTINIAGVKLTPQEMRNAVYSGPFVTAAKAVFSDANQPVQQIWATYVKGDPRRQEVLERALEWVSDARIPASAATAAGPGKIDLYMSAHRASADIGELRTYFESVIGWSETVFTEPDPLMRGLPWGRYYEKYHANPYDPETVARRIRELLADDSVKNPRGIWEYVRGGEADTRLLEIRVFDRKTALAAYRAQTDDAKARGVSNCPLCTTGHAANAKRIYGFEEMQADHVAAWSKGGATATSNCQMLCKTHNAAKGNR